MTGNKSTSQSSYRRSANSDPLTDAWAVWDAVGSRLQADRVSPSFLQGMTGGVARGYADRLTRSDLDALARGLEALGIQAKLVPLPDAEWPRPLRAQIRRTGLPLFAFQNLDPHGEQEKEQNPGVGPGHSGWSEESRDRHLRPDLPAGQEFTPSDIRLPIADASILDQTLAIEICSESDGEESEITIRSAQGRGEKTKAVLLRSRFTHALILTRAEAKGFRRNNIRSALGRWAAFAAAFPLRGIDATEEDESIRALGARFLLECAKERQDRASNRLRYAARYLEDCQLPEDVQEAHLLIQEAVCIELHLPPAVQRALLTPPEIPLSDLERRDMIYLARAGATDLKIMAARRLTYERHHSDAERTLEQLRYDPDARVRASAIFCAPLA